MSHKSLTSRLWHLLLSNRLPQNVGHAGVQEIAILQVKGNIDINGDEEKKRVLATN